MKIFISYRHNPAASGTASLIRARLVDYFGAGSVFLDSDFFVPGDLFPKALEDHVADCDVLLVLIDPHWIQSMPRLSEPKDWVRREIEAVIARLQSGQNVRVLPVLMFGATMPERARLPESIATLSDLHAAPPLRESVLEQDIAALIKHLEGWSLDRWLLWMRARRRAALGVSVGALVLFCASVMALFDALTVDSRLQTLVLGLADVIADPPPSDRLQLVAIDRESEARLGRPFDSSWRREHALLLRRLAAEGAAVVVFDVHLRGRSAHDAELVAAARQAQRAGTRVVFGRPARHAGSALPPDAADLGLLCVGTELGWARTAPLAARRVQPAAAPPPLLSLATLAVWPGARVLAFDTERQQLALGRGDGAAQLVGYSRTDTVSGQQTCDTLAGGDEVAQRIVRFARLEHWRDPARRQSYAQLLSAPPEGGPRYRDKIVLVGSELDAEDRRQIYRGLGTEQRFGYEIQADVINTLLHDVDIRRLGDLPQFGATLAFGLLGVAGRFWRWLWPRGRCSVFVVAVLVAGVAGAAAWCAMFDVLPNMAYPLAAFVFALWLSGQVLRSQGLWHGRWS